MIAAHRRRQQLALLVESLRRLVAILRLDSACRWRTHFEAQLAQAEHLLADGFEPEQLHALSSSVCHVYGGMGSFSDYFPGYYDPATGRCTLVPGTEDFSAASGAVYEQAQELRVVGRR